MTKSTNTAVVDENTPRLDLTYLYRAEGIDGSLLYAWAENEGNGKKRYYAGPNNIVRYASPGIVYSFATIGTNIFIGEPPRLVKRLSGPKVVEWAALDRTMAQKLALLREQESASKHDPLEKALDPVREAYWQRSAPQRAQLLAWLVNYITSPIS